MVSMFGPTEDPEENLLGGGNVHSVVTCPEGKPGFLISHYPSSVISSSGTFLRDWWP